jgi:hypothetical protein
MIRRLVGIVLLAAATGAVVAGAERATFVLTNGQRVSGELTYKGGTVYTLDGRDYPSDQVAVIDFTGGDPPASELRQLPKSVTREHERDVFAMRDGQIVQGKLYHIAADGSSVSFDPLGTTGTGDRRTVPSSQIARIYINAPKAREVYASVLDRPGTAAATAGTAGVASSNGITVQANQPWTETGITVRQGQRISFSATGQIQIGADRSAGPDGADRGGTALKGFPVPQMGPGGLIFRVGNSRAYPIGSNTQPIAMPADGRLFLGVNDDHHGDNAGSFSVVVKRTTAQ